MWQKTGPIAQGGSVLSIAVNQAGQVWLATGAGILQQAETGWQPIPHSRPLPVVTVLGAGHNTWWCAGLAGGLLRSHNQGESWQPGWLDQVETRVNCLAVSPRYRHDYTLLAGTDGAGVLRSTDGGRRWLLSSFGLQNFTILALAVAGDWSRREVVLAGTLAGIYRSSGGGRAWKPVGLAGLAIQAIAASAHFAENGLVLAGSEGQGLYRSVDGGQSWQPVAGGFPTGAVVNALACYDDSGQEIWLAGTDEGRLWRSADGGQSWVETHRVDDSILVLGHSPTMLLAGLHEEGLLASTGGGQQWQLDPHLPGRGFQRLSRAGKGRWLALAPGDGAWLSTDDGQTWQQQLKASLGEPILALLAWDESWLAARTDGLWRGESGQGRQQVLAAEEPVVVLATGPEPDSPVWAATATAHLWHSTDRGVTWQPIEAPFSGQQLMALATAQAEPLVAVLEGREARLWRQRQGQWQPELSQPVTLPYAHLAPNRLALDKTVWAYSDGQGWQKMATFEETIRQISPDGESLYVLAGPEVFHLAPDGHPTPLPRPDRASQVVDIQAAGEGHLLALSTTGDVWRFQAG